MPQRVRHTLEELGPTYIKLGQILSTRPDLLPPEYIIELSKLLDAAPPISYQEVAQTIERELGYPVDHWFASFDPTPIASASIGQVRFLEARSETLRGYGLVDIIEHFSQAIRDELDYSAEGHNADRLRHAVDEESVWIPKVHWDLSTRRVITLDELKGIKLSETDELRARGYDLHEIAQRVVRVYLEQVFVHGVFHADPHPANILICDGRVGLVDFGVVGYLSSRTKGDLGDLLFALAQQRPDDMVRIVVRMGAVAREADLYALRRDIGRLLMRYYSTSLEDLPVAQFLGEVMSVAFKYHVRLPSDLALLARTVVVLEGVTRNLDPSLVLAKFLEPFVIQLIKERVSLKRTVIESVNTLRELERVLHTLPRRVDVISEQLERGEMTLGVDIRRLNRAMRKVEAIGNRICFSVVVAAIIVGSALILTAGKEAATFQLPFTDIGLPIAQIGFVTAALMGGWLLLSIARSKDV